MLKKKMIFSFLAVFLLVTTFCLFAQSGCGRFGRQPATGRSAGISFENKLLPKTQAERKIAFIIGQMDKDSSRRYANVSPSDGRCLRLLTEALDAKRVVEIGTSTGCSGLWFAMALRSTGGKLITHEIDADRIKMARKNFNRADVNDLITIIEGDAHKTIMQHTEPIDILFIDADKEGYTDYLNKLLPLVRPGGLILAHNINMQDKGISDYVKAVTTNPDLDTIFYEEGDGLSITLKKREPSPDYVYKFFEGVENNPDMIIEESSLPIEGKTDYQSKKYRKLDVVFVPTPQDVVDKMLELANVKKDDLVYDLGCGDGRIVVTAAKRYGCKAVGFDIDPQRIRESLENVKDNNVGDLVRIEQKDIFTLDLSEADVITLFLLPSLNVRLIPQLEKVKPGTRIVSHSYDMQGVKPDKVLGFTSNEDQFEHKIYLWTAPIKKENGI
jgi:predicted O-methyltransferase YrrM/SAM-dependent methyltransferase